MYYLRSAVSFSVNLDLHNRLVILSYLGLLPIGRSLPAETTSLIIFIMGQGASRYEGGAKSVKAGLALSVSGVREVSVLRYSHPAPLPIGSSVHKNIIDPARAPETPQHGNPQTLSDPSTDIHNAIKEVPVEIFLKIVEYLSPASVRSLSYTCRSLSRMFDASAAELMGKPPKRPRLEPSWNVTNLWYQVFGKEAKEARSSTEPNQWWELLVMLHRDNMWPGNVVCNACIGVHTKSAFSQSSLHSPPTESNCLGTTGCVEICPHAQLDFWRLKKICNSPKAYKRVLREKHARFPEDSKDEEIHPAQRAWEAGLDPKQMEEVKAERAQEKEARALARANVAAEQERGWTTKTKTMCNQCAIPVMITSWGESRVCFPLAVISRWEPKYRFVPSAKDLANHMKSLEPAVCPHLKMNSSEVMSAYCQNFKKGGWHCCKCPACSVPYQKCALCHARFWYDIGDFRNLEHVLCLFVERRFDPSVGVANSTWINQLIPVPNEYRPWGFKGPKFVESTGGYQINEHSIKLGEYSWGVFYPSL